MGFYVIALYVWAGFSVASFHGTAVGFQCTAQCWQSQGRDQVGKIYAIRLAHMVVHDLETTWQQQQQQHCVKP